MDIKLPITAWFSYTAARHECTIDFVWPPGQGQPEVHLLSHNALSDDSLWTDAAYRMAGISEVVSSYVEAVRIAYSAATVPEAKDDATLVPFSCLNYLDAAVLYTLGTRFKLYQFFPRTSAEFQTRRPNFYYLLGSGAKVYLDSLYREDWLDAMVFFRSIRTLYKTEYAVEVGVIESSVGTPVLLGRIPKARSL
jgi:hypothetical protein